MIAPDFKTFKSFAKKGNLVAVSMSIPADLETPVSCFLKVAGSAPHAFLLESAEQEEKVGRYSFIGFDPDQILTARDGDLEVRRDRQTQLLVQTDLVGTIQKNLASYHLVNPESLPAFCGGFVGFLSYENVQIFEDIELQPRPGPDLPDGIFFLTKNLVIFDHFRKTLSITVLVDVGRGVRAERAYREARRKIQRCADRLCRPLRPTSSRKREIPVSPQANMTRAQFCEKVKKIKNYIRAGDCIQVVLSQRFTLPAITDDFRIYRALRSINPSPYMFYFRSAATRLIGSSPELLVKKIGREVEVRPIAGTRPRGRNMTEDLLFEENLKKSPKEMAEHLMLVDLGRNDLGRVSVFDSVKVRDFARVERYSHVMHLVSQVLGKLRPSKDSFDLLRAVFPAGTVTGAPKIRAMQIINELEPEKRGPYAGCLGYFSFNQNMDMCITIRTLVIQGKKAYLQAGAGIVKDSSPIREYQETLNKAQAVLKALQQLGDF